MLLTNERIVFTSPISIKAGFFSSLRHRQLILTDFPRLLAIKEDAGSDGQSLLSVKSESVFVAQPSVGTNDSSTSSSRRMGAGAGNRVVDVHDKGEKGFVVETVSYF
jgi:hypothetical protein